MYNKGIHMRMIDSVGQKLLKITPRGQVAHLLDL
jgi:hypothetical protein